MIKFNSQAKPTKTRIETIRYHPVYFCETDLRTKTQNIKKNYKRGGRVKWGNPYIN